MANPWNEMQTGELYKALLSKDPDIALKQLQHSKRTLTLTANRARIKSGKKLMNHFHRKLMDLIEGYQEDEGENYLNVIREVSASDIIDNIWDDKFETLLRDYMEHCYD